MPRFGSFSAFESVDDRFLREIEQALALIEYRSGGNPGERGPELPARISEIRRRVARYERLSGRPTLALERFWSATAGLFFSRRSWESWDVAKMTASSWSGPEREEAESRGFWGGLWVSFCLVFAAFVKPWFVLPAAVVALLTALVVWLPLERSRLREALLQIQGLAEPGSLRAEAYGPRAARPLLGGTRPR